MEGKEGSSFVYGSRPACELTSVSTRTKYYKMSPRLSLRIHEYLREILRAKSQKPCAEEARHDTDASELEL